jgi:hypothetical protein
MGPKLLLTTAVILTAVNMHAVSSLFVDARCLKSVSSGGASYAALDIGEGPTSTASTCQDTFLSLPEGWIIAPVTENSKAVVAAYPWGTEQMLMQGGRLFCTSNQVQYPSRIGKEFLWLIDYPPSPLIKSGNQYKSHSCPGRILLKYGDAESSVLVSCCKCNTATLLLLELG